MRISEKAQRAGHRIARATPSYNDEVSEDFILKQQARIEEHYGRKPQLTPISGDAW
jgi:hypothetical protein